MAILLVTMSMAPVLALDEGYSSSAAHEAPLLPRDPLFETFKDTSQPGFPEGYQEIDRIPATYTFTKSLDVKAGVVGTGRSELQAVSGPVAVLYGQGALALGSGIDASELPLVVHEITSDVRIAFYGLEDPDNLKVDVTVLKDAVATTEDPVSIDCNNKFKYAVVSLPADDYPGITTARPLTRTGAEGIITLLPTVADKQTVHIYIATSILQPSPITDAALAAFYSWAKNNVNSPDEAKHTVALSFVFYYEHVDNERRDATACLVLGQWAGDFKRPGIPDLNPSSAACYFGDTAGALTPVVGAFKAVGDAIRAALNGKSDECTIALASAIPAGKIAKLFKIEGKLGTGILKLVPAGERTIAHLWTAENRGVKIVLEEGVLGEGGYGFNHIKDHLEGPKGFKALVGWNGNEAVKDGIKEAVQNGHWAVPYGTETSNIIYRNTGRTAAVEGVRSPIYVAVVIGDNGALKDSVITAYPVTERKLKEYIAKLRKIEIRKIEDLDKKIKLDQ